MTNLTFLTQVLAENIWLYIVSLLICIIIYIPIIKRVVYNFFDPLLFALVFAILANSIPMFLYFTDYISNDKFAFVVISEVLFWFGYFLCAKNKIQFSGDSIVNDNKISYVLFWFFLALNILSHLITYSFFGIPLFNETRLSTYTNSGGWGLLSHISKFASFYILVYGFYLYFNKPRSSPIFIFVILTSVVFSFLSGSKSSILEIFFAFFIYKYFYEKTNISFKSMRKYLFIGFLFPFIVIGFQHGSGASTLNSLVSFSIRLLANGDVYWMGFPNDLIDLINIKNPFNYLFSRILGPFRIIDISSVPAVIGAQLYWINYPSWEGVMKGPNTRLPVLSWVLFRWFGLFLSFFIGVFCAWWRTRITQHLPHGIITVILYGYVYLSFNAFFTDPLLASSSIFSMSISFFVIYVLYVLIGGGYLKIKKNV